MFDWNRPKCIPVYPEATWEPGRSTGTKPGGFQTILDGDPESERGRKSDGSDSYRSRSMDVTRCVGFQTMFISGGEGVARAAWLSTLAAQLASFLSQNGTPRTTVPPTVAEAPQDEDVRFPRQQPLSLSHPLQFGMPVWRWLAGPHPTVAVVAAFPPFLPHTQTEVV